MQTSNLVVRVTPVGSAGYETLGNGSGVRRRLTIKYSGGIGLSPKTDHSRHSLLLVICPLSDYDMDSRRMEPHPDAGTQTHNRALRLCVCLHLYSSRDGHLLPWAGSLRQGPVGAAVPAHHSRSSRFERGRPALLASLLAFFAWNYHFLPPFHTLLIADPKDWISLIAFLVVGVAVGVQTGRLRERETEALARERHLALLNEFSAHLVSETTIPDMVDTLARQIRGAVGASRVALFMPDESGTLREIESRSGSCKPACSAIEGARWVRRESKAIGLPVPRARSEMGGGGWPVSVDAVTAGLKDAGKDVFIPLQTASRQEGVLFIGGRSDGTGFSLETRG